MKTFWAALIIFGLLLLLIAGNAVFIHHTATELEDRLSDLPPCAEATDAVNDLQAFWQKRQEWVGLSVSYEEIRKLDECIIEMQSACAQGEESDFETAKCLAFSAVAYIRRLERFSPENLF